MFWITNANPSPPRDLPRGYISRRKRSRQLTHLQLVYTSSIYVHVTDGLLTRNMKDVSKPSRTCICRLYLRAAPQQSANRTNRTRAPQARIPYSSSLVRFRRSEAQFGAAPTRCHHTGRLHDDRNGRHTKATQTCITCARERTRRCGGPTVIELGKTATGAGNGDTPAETVPTPAQKSRNTSTSSTDFVACVYLVHLSYLAPQRR